MRDRQDFESLALRLPPGYLPVVSQLESRGQPSARNPRSRATGEFQFVDRTWNWLAQQYPFLGLTDRTDPEQSRTAAAAYAIQNQRGLRDALGRESTAPELYLAHHFGLRGAQTLFQDPSGRLPDGVVSANPQFRGMTNADVVRSVTDQFEGSRRRVPTAQGGGDYQQPPQQPPATRGALSMPNHSEELPPSTGTGAYIQQDPNQPRQPPGLFSRGGLFGSPESLIALGAGILGGADQQGIPSLGAGLSQGVQAAQGVQQRAQQAEQQTEQRRLQQVSMVAKLIEAGVPPAVAQQMAAGGGQVPANLLASIPTRSRVSASELFRDTAGAPFQSVLNQDGSRTITNMITGQAGATFEAAGARGTPERMPISATAANGWGRDGVEQVQQLTDRAREAQQRLGELERMTTLGPAVVGSDLATSLQRYLVQATGMQIGRITPESVSELQRLFASSQLRASDVFRGQGQVTESERRILAESLPNMFSNPTAYTRAIGVMQSVERRRLAMGEAWNSLDPAQQREYGNDGLAFRRWMSEAERNLLSSDSERQTRNPDGIFGRFDPNAVFGSRPSQATPAQGGGQTPGGSGAFAPAEQALRDAGARPLNNGTITGGNGRSLQWRRVQ